MNSSPTTPQLPSVVRTRSVSERQTEEKGEIETYTEREREREREGTGKQEVKNKA